MPELPEVETTRAGIAPFLEQQTIQTMQVFQRSLRWPIPANLPEIVSLKKVNSVKRRAKYILLELELGAIIVHLGMSGSMRVCKGEEPRKKHDHWQMHISNGATLRYNDPRRFGACLWHAGDWQDHHLISILGPEPLSQAFDAPYLFKSTRNRARSIKQHIMDGHVVVGVGNIYAAEALFHSGINPLLEAKKLSQKRAIMLVQEIKKILQQAIKKGGTTLRDYSNGDGQPGYFQQELWVYGHEGQPCKQCKQTLKSVRIGQRSSVYCPKCQKR